MQGKTIAIAGGLGIFAVLGIIIYFVSRGKVKQGIEYDLGTASEQFSLSPSVAVVGPGTGSAPAPDALNVLNPDTEPARSLIARQVQTLQLSPNTMDDIRLRYGANSGLFQGVDDVTKAGIKKAFQKTYSINPDSYLSYPIWTQYESPALLPELKARRHTLAVNWDTVGTKDAKFYVDKLTVPAWRIDFVKESFNGELPRALGWASYQNFLKNSIDAIEKLEAGIKNEAIQILRRQGYKFEGYDANPIF